VEPSKTKAGTESVKEDAQQRAKIMVNAKNASAEIPNAVFIAKQGEVEVLGKIRYEQAKGELKKDVIWHEDEGIDKNSDTKSNEDDRQQFRGAPKENKEKVIRDDESSNEGKIGLRRSLKVESESSEGEKKRFNSEEKQGKRFEEVKEKGKISGEKAKVRVDEKKAMKTKKENRRKQKRRFSWKREVGKSPIEILGQPEIKLGNHESKWWTPKKKKKKKFKTRRSKIASKRTISRGFSKEEEGCCTAWIS